MKILVTGGAGYIGAATTDLLLENDHEVIVVDSLENGHKENLSPAAKFVQGNIGDAELMRQIFADQKPEAVMHFAGYIDVGESVQKPEKYFENNEARAKIVAQEALAAGVKAFIFSSTAAVYGQPKEIPIKETTPADPVNPYGTSKLKFEQDLLELSKEGMHYIALRYFNACGATERIGEEHDPESHLIPNLLAAAAGEQKEFSLNGTDYDTPDGTCIRDFVHIYDIAQAHLTALKAIERQIAAGQTPAQELSAHAYNISLGRGFSVKEVLSAAEKVTGRTIPFKDNGRRPGDPARLIADPSKIKALGWQPKYESIEEIIATAWKKRKKMS